MPNTPVVIDVATLVADRISRFSGVLLTRLEEEQTLLGDLNMKHPACVQLAESLRGVVRMFNRNGTVDVGEVEDGGATVRSMIDLVAERSKR